MREIPYALKYGPLVECLRGHGEEAWLRNYPPEIFEHFRKLNERAIRDYMSELRLDFEALYKALLPAAIDDPSLAEAVKSASDDLLALERLIRRRTPSQIHEARDGLAELLATMQALRSLMLGPIS